MNNACKRCEILYSTQGTREEILKSVERLPNRERADGEIVERRIAVCCECDRLAGETCLACGCYVEFRASQKRGTCPKGKWHVRP